MKQLFPCKITGQEIHLLIYLELDLHSVEGNVVISLSMKYCNLASVELCIIMTDYIYIYICFQMNFRKVAQHSYDVSFCLSNNLSLYIYIQPTHSFLKDIRNNVIRTCHQRTRWALQGYYKPNDLILNACSLVHVIEPPTTKLLPLLPSITGQTQDNIFLR